MFARGLFGAAFSSVRPKVGEKRTEQRSRAVMMLFRSRYIFLILLPVLGPFRSRLFLEDVGLCHAGALELHLLPRALAFKGEARDLDYPLHVTHAVEEITQAVVEAGILDLEGKLGIEILRLDLFGSEVLY